MLRRILCVIFALLLAGCGLGCASFSDTAPYTATWLDVFDTVTNLSVYEADSPAFEEQAQALHDRLVYYHRLFDIYHTYEGLHNLKTINDAAGGQPVEVEEPILALLEYGLDAYEQTGGKVNILFGAVLSLWHDSRSAALQDPTAATLPDSDTLQQAARHVDPACLIIDRQAGTVCISDPAARLDVGAIAKGYAAELAAAYAAQELGWTSALLDVGGNVRAIGGKSAMDGQKPFSIGVRNPDPDSARAYLLTVAIEDCAVVTSGDYQRYFEVEGKRYAHIIDPDTLQPAAHVRAVTVICPHSGQADLLSTALFVLPIEEGRKLLERFSDTEAVWMLPDGSLQYSDGFKAYIK